MNIQEAKSIRLVDFLAGLGYEPVIQRGNSVWYRSPFRTEKEASFKVDIHKELWYDFGLGKGGDIITLAKELYHTHDIRYVLRCIEGKRAVLKPVAISCPFEEDLVSRIILQVGYAMSLKGSLTFCLSDRFFHSW